METEMNRRSLLLSATAMAVAPMLPPDIFTAAVEKSRDCGMWRLLTAEETLSDVRAALDFYRVFKTPFHN